jgi:hypothetical protein
VEGEEREAQIVEEWGVLASMGLATVLHLRARLRQDLGVSIVVVK